MDYLLDVFELAEAGLDESKKRRFVGILSYITHLIKFKDRHSMDGVTSAKRHKLPSILSQKFSSLFGATNDTRIPDDKLKLLISYILVLSLFADDFRSDPLDIAKDLRMNPITLRPHYEYLGCKFVRDNQVLLATLPVPLEFQTIKRKRRSVANPQTIPFCLVVCGAANVLSKTGHVFSFPISNYASAPAAPVLY
ncbi:UNVERIFIED_CONTAM: hypothetical protein Scaly_2514100 [Sesamum calycinum]|uniref:Uncharacterized protein n=1 Tax=Sesamum calycinum TaxID=2727403 RepID=A0AAW2LTM3_9LAMI